MRIFAALGTAALLFVPEQQGHPAAEPGAMQFAPPLSGGAERIPALDAASSLLPESAHALALEPARPFAASYGDAASALRAETCLTEAIYYEGALEPEAGQRAIAQVVLNRVRHPAYPDNVCGVVFEGQHLSTGCQFSFTCDGSRARRPVAALWNRARRVAQAALGGSVAEEVGLSTHYHADYVAPAWSGSLDPSGQIGRHLFYRWRGAAGRPAAFSDDYTGREPQIAAWNAGERDTADAAVESAEAPSTANPAAETPSPQPPAPPTPFRARPLRLAEAGAEGK